MLFGDKYYTIMSFSLVDSLTMNILRIADGFCNVRFLMYFCHDFVLPDRTDAEMFLIFTTDWSVITTKFVWNTVVWRETDKTKSMPLCYQSFPMMSWFAIFTYPQHSMKDMKMGKSKQ